MDLRGHGLSGGPRGHCAPRNLILKDIDALIEKAKTLYPGVPIILYGHSLGGNIALDYKSRGKYNDLPVAFIISAPWLLMHGTDDKVCDIKGSRALYKRAPENCTFIPWEGYFHEIHNGNETSRGEEVILRMIQWNLELKG